MKMLPYCRGGSTRKEHDGNSDGENFDGDENVKFLFGVVVKGIYRIVKTH